MVVVSGNFLENGVEKKKLRTLFSRGVSTRTHIHTQTLLRLRL